MRGVKEKHNGLGNDTIKDNANLVLFVVYEHLVASRNDNGTKEGNGGDCATLITTIAPNTVSGEPSRKSVNFCTLNEPAKNRDDVVISLESIRAISQRFANKAYDFFLGDTWPTPLLLTMSEVLSMSVNLPCVRVARFLDTFWDEVPKKIVLDMVKNLNNHRQATRGVPIGPKFSYKSAKQIYRPVSNKNGASTSRKKKQVEMSRKEVSNSNSFDALNLIENDDDLERIDKIERQMIEWKLLLVYDDGKPIPKVVSMVNADSDSQVEQVFDECATFMASTGLKRGSDSGYGTNSLKPKRIDKIERQMIEGKLLLVDDDGKPIPKVVFTINADSDSQVKQSALDALCERFHIPDVVHPELPGHNDKILNSPVEMDLFAFICHSDPMKVKIGERESKEGEEDNIDVVNEDDVDDTASQSGEGVMKTASGASGSGHPSKKLRGDHGASRNIGARTGEKSLAAIQELFEQSTLNLEVGITAATTVPFVTSFVTPTLEHEGGDYTDCDTPKFIHRSGIQHWGATS
nr:hypothetical protein [Tanacetum cinerariifolium]